ncbi:hypothetical protein [Massilia sp. METH4]|uniref:hypothetical protein n=1 Tax=Massilia sp. METH4 TaxID=3123041 RepID=UPI0030D1B88D
MKRILSLVLAASLLGGMPAARAGTASEASMISGLLSGLVVVGSIAATGSTVVESVEKVGDGVELLLTNTSNASKATVRLSGRAAQQLSVAAGTTLDVVATSTGHLLVLSGKVLAFVPNELGKALLHHAEVK